MASGKGTLESLLLPGRWIRTPIPKGENVNGGKERCGWWRIGARFSPAPRAAVWGTSPGCPALTNTGTGMALTGTGLL